MSIHGNVLSYNIKRIGFNPMVVYDLENGR